jgi:hypothetical protein
MRRLSALLLIPVLLFSCQKEKDATIVGSWEQIARYSQDVSGQYSWSYVNDTYPYRITFTADGKYSVIFYEPMGEGKYQYDYATRQLRFEDMSSGTISFSPVSYLDPDYLVIDVFHNGTFYAKNKYERK